MTDLLKRLLLASLLLGALIGTDVSAADSAASVDLSLRSIWTFFGGQDGAEMGYSVSSAGDVNGDGYADVIIGSPLYTRQTPDGVYREGAAFVFYGSPGGLQSEPDWEVGSGIKGPRFGHAVAGVGDLNNDGYDDVVIGAPEYPVDFGDNGVPKSGAILVFLGSALGLSPEPAAIRLAEAREIGFGFAVAPAGDVNGDQYADLIVGAPWYANGQSSEGKVYVYFGGPEGLAETADWSYECNAISASCGYTVSSAGDLDRDGYAEIVVGAPYYDGLIQNGGRVLVFSGSPAGPVADEPGLIDGQQAEGLFGYSVSGAGDVNADGYADLAVGAAHGDCFLPDVGAAFVYLGSAQGFRSYADWAACGEQTDGGFGAAVRNAGDINADGYADLLVGAYLFGEQGSLYDQPDEGAVYLYLGGRTGLGITAVWTASGDKADAWFGFAAAGAGDIDGDLADDLIVGAPKYRLDEKTIMGQASVFLGSSSSQTLTYIFIPSFIVQGP